MWYTLLPYMVMSVFNVIYMTRTRREDSDSESVTQTLTRKHRMPYTQCRCLRPCFHSFLTPTLNESDHKSAENCWQSFYCFFSIPINKAVILLCLGSLLKVFRHFFHSFAVCFWSCLFLHQITDIRFYTTVIRRSIPVKVKRLLQIMIFLEISSRGQFRGCEYIWQLFSYVCVIILVLLQKRSGRYWLL